MVCLRLFTTTLKNLAVELNAFIMTSTQVSNDNDEKGGFRDFKNVQGSRWLYYIFSHFINEGILISNN